MSNTQHVVEAVNPADLNPDTLICYAQFQHLMGANAPKRETIERYSRRGQFVPGARLGGPRKPMMFRAGDVAVFLSARMSGLAGAFHQVAQ